MDVVNKILSVQLQECDSRKPHTRFDTVVYSIGKDGKSWVVRHNDRPEIKAQGVTKEIAVGLFISKLIVGSV